MKGEVEDPPLNVDISAAVGRRQGTDMTLITYGGSLHKVMDAASTLEDEGLDPEVIDLRVLRPLDIVTVVESVSRTHRAVIIDEGWKSGGISAEISARLVEECFYELDSPIGTCGGAEVPIPYAKHLEDASVPQPEHVVAAARDLMPNG